MLNISFEQLLGENIDKDLFLEEQYYLIYKLLVLELLIYKNLENEMKNKLSFNHYKTEVAIIGDSIESIILAL